uniref:Uncharacterized protein n=1 Tax=Globodera rostochiensis TaxID=31243 RepID=A0A914IAP1_GLORO
MYKFAIFVIIFCAPNINIICGLNCWTEVKTTHPEGFGLSLRKMRCPEGGGTKMQCAETKCVTRNGYTTVGKACADRLYCETTRSACEFGGDGRLEMCDLCDGDLCNGTGTMRSQWPFALSFCAVVLVQLLTSKLM